MAAAGHGNAGRPVAAGETWGGGTEVDSLWKHDRVTGLVEARARGDVKSLSMWPQTAAPRSKELHREAARAAIGTTPGRARDFELTCNLIVDLRDCEFLLHRDFGYRHSIAIPL